VANTSAVSNCTLAVSALKSPVVAQKFAVVGTYADDRPFVRHSSLLRAEDSIGEERKVTVHHMGPPIEVDDQCECHVIGQVGLTNEEIEAIEDWISSVATQYCSIKVLPFQQYVIVPHMDCVISEEDRPLRQRFSCVGYVIEAYQKAEVVLLKTDELPDAHRQDVEKAYPGLDRIANNPVHAKKFGFVSYGDIGLPGDGPWKIPLPGYLFHSTARYRSDAARPEPFVPTSIAQACYP
jgi:hypothetical protein